MPARVVFLPDDTKEDDYAILKLEQPIEITPLKVAQKIENPDTYSPTITVIGYPGPDQNYENTNVVRVYNRTVDSTTFEINEIYKE